MCNRIKAGDAYALESPNSLYEQYKPILGDHHESIISCKIILAQLNADLGEFIKARAFYDLLVPKVKARYLSGKNYTIDILIRYIFFYVRW